MLKQGKTITKTASTLVMNRRIIARTVNAIFRRSFQHVNSYTKKVLPFKSIIRPVLSSKLSLEAKKKFMVYKISGFVVRTQEH